ncbi:winged helix DNA-binding protein [Mycobacterium paragordonae]|jgi:DNA-binding MarR family transcriptional regulator|uniref:Winged helix DNA-binding protein n=1 Tax=Mycobacterium paragordonae TaxID=1389713 RepID=A0A4V6PMV1_9MYCO|nr:winged helix DNA-binding protein [Mycobacterium paragordonae]MDP7733198.1 winged helix DNA-binding protein [Mycobacterium paragordonae]TDK98024.1 MarR family transcriptional regulator [Mycobacterium paragordonae]TDL08768.1 MarR family transcriptional regulator [Mycobacterium paragordonae]
MMDLQVLQAVRLKGRVSPADLARTLDADDAETETAVRRLVDAGLLIEGATVRITPDGRARLAELLTAERQGVDGVAIDAAYHQFRSVNADFKALVTDWQLRDDQPNDHRDAGYDAAVLARLDDVHRRVTPIIAAVTAQLPRLRGYPAKLAVALDKVKAGEIAWLTRPLIDSYHTVWFELHEELILAAGLTREQAARSGDAQ